MNDKFPAQAYKDNVLADCFEDAKSYFLTHYLDVDRAHALMLAEQDILSRKELRTILQAIQGLDLEKIRATRYDGSVEDLFFSEVFIIEVDAREDAAPGADDRHAPL